MATPTTLGSLFASQKVAATKMSDLLVPSRTSSIQALIESKTSSGLLVLDVESLPDKA